MAKITYFGPDRFWFDRGFFDDDGLFAEMEVRSSSATRIVAVNPATHARVIALGTGFSLDPVTEEPTGGTITSMTFKENGIQAQITGISLDFPTFVAALDAVNSPSDTGQLDALFAQYAWTIDATKAVAGVFHLDAVSPLKPVTLKGSAYDDLLQGGDAADKMVGNGGADALAGGGGNDKLFGGAGADMLEGGRGQDLAVGGGGRDMLWGGRGTDRLNGGRGDDFLDGGLGADLFIFNGRANEGSDVIADFDDGFDRIRIAGASFDDLTIANGADGAVVTLASGTEITLLDVDAASLDASDFIFV